ncbi:MAG: hypothetical protein WA208_08020 [Thermoanaerobaculia bacterium]
MFAFIVGLLSAIVGLIPQVQLTWQASALVFVVSLVVAIGCAASQARATELPIEKLLSDAQANTYQLSLETVTDHAHVKAVNQAAARLYPTEPLNVDKYEQWLMVNPNILVCLFDQSRRIVGYFDVFPLRADFMSCFVEGVCGESDIRHDHVLAPAEAARVQTVYLAGVAVFDPEASSAPKYAAVLVWGVLRYLQCFYGAPPGRDVVAAAATRNGEALLRKLGFVVVTPAGTRRDNVPLYRLRLSDESMGRVMRSIPDWSHVCRLSWTAGHPQLALVRGARGAA